MDYEKIGTAIYDATVHPDDATRIANERGEGGVVLRSELLLALEQAFRGDPSFDLDSFEDAVWGTA